MKLKDYINYRGRGKGVKTNEYNLRTQHFYDGKPVKIENTIYPGIKANFMNSLAIPSPDAIAHLQKRYFQTIAINKAQGKTLIALQGLNNPASFQAANVFLEGWTLDLIHKLEQGIDNVLKEKDKLQKVLKTPNSILDYTDLNKAFFAFQNIWNGIKKEMPIQSIDKYTKELDLLLTQANSKIASQPNHILDKNAYLTSAGKPTTLINKLINLSYQIKGVSLFEHQAIDFIKRFVKIPENIEFIGTGQVLVAGKQASQDALFFEKGLQVVLSDGKKVDLKSYLEELKSGNKTVALTYDEWNSVLSQGAIGLQSKYSRWGNIKMSSMSLKELFVSQASEFNYVRALRNMYILNNQVDENNIPQITHKFNVKRSKDYSLLFSAALAKFMDKIMSNNHFMVTAKYGVIDAVSYYNHLFNSHQYFRPSGAISLAKGDLDKKYNISIKE